MTALAAEQDLIDDVLAAWRMLGAAVYARESLPDGLPPAWSEIEVTRRPGGNTRSGGPSALFGLYDITERSVGRHPAKLRDHRDQVAAIEGQTFTIAGRESTPVTFNGADPITAEAGEYVGFRTWTFALF